VVERSEGDKSATFSAGFSFARQLRNPQIRAGLRALGWTSAQHIVIAVDDEPVVDVVARIVFHETDGRALIALTSSESTEEPRRFRLMVVEVAKAMPGSAADLKLGPGASIGMLYDALHPSGTYLPSEWVKALQFARVNEAA
jgi:hypothetical protein